MATKGDLLVNERMLNKYDEDRIGDLSGTGIKGDTIADQLSKVPEMVYGVKIVSWADGTDAEIAAMVKAADEGKLNLADFWKVGDARTIHLSPMEATGVGESHVEQDVTFTLFSADTGVEDKTNPCWNYQYVTETTGRKWPSFIVQQTTGLKELGYMNPTATNAGGWRDCARRTWCNNVFRAAIPETLRGIFKQVKVNTAIDVSLGTMSIATTEDYFFFPTEGDMKTKQSESEKIEFDLLSQWEGFKKLIKISTNGWEGGYGAYWIRMAGVNTNLMSYAYNTSYGVSVHHSGVADDSTDFGIVPAGCI